MMRRCAEAIIVICIPSLLPLALNARVTTGREGEREEENKEKRGNSYRSSYLPWRHAAIRQIVHVIRVQRSTLNLRVSFRANATI